jgi:hypothetical protein
VYITDTLILAIKTYFCLKTVKNQSRYGNCASTWQNRFVQLVHVWLPFQNQRWGWKPNNDNNLKRTETCMWLETSQHIELYWHLTTSHQGLCISNRYWNCHALDWKVKDQRKGYLTWPPVTCYLSWIFIYCLDNRCCQRIHHWSPES